MSFLHRFQNMYINPPTKAAPAHLIALSERLRDALQIRKRIKRQRDLGERLQQTAIWIALDLYVSFVDMKGKV